MAFYWKTKEFKSQEAMDKWREANAHRYQMTEVFINNGFCLEYRDLKIIDIP